MDIIDINRVTDYLSDQNSIEDAIENVEQINQQESNVSAVISEGMKMASKKNKKETKKPNNKKESNVKSKIPVVKYKLIREGFPKQFEDTLEKKIKKGWTPMFDTFRYTMAGYAVLVKKEKK